MKKISVIIPLYNRAHFLKRALDCVLAQTYKNIEVILVDDGSTDSTKEIVDQLNDKYSFKIDYFYQLNSGAAIARQTGVTHATGGLIAFLDSDDLWLDYYLETMAHLLATNNINWVYCPVSRHKLGSELVLSANSFYINGNERAFLGLSTIKKGELFIYDDDLAVTTQIKSGLFLGFQNTVFKRTVFDHLKIPNIRIGEDRLMAIMLIKSGCKGGYIKKVMVQCFEHDANTSDVGNKPLEEKAKVYLQLIEGFECYSSYIDLSTAEKRALKQKIAHEYFWNIGNYIYLGNSYKRLASYYMLKGVISTPFDITKWFNFTKRVCVWLTRKKAG
ncbi:MAG: glycosyltransferase involved in cell wall biosynthesis [Paraglaciecola sp.]|jgi:glycosyltransferase involved in cell wall biosynthesis